MRAFGFEPEDLLIDQTIDVWPENVTAVRVFLAMRTQWRTGPAGRTGLDYGALPEVWRRLKVPPAERDEVFSMLGVLEMAALSAMHDLGDEE